jgi:hypothetical protein
VKGTISGMAPFTSFRVTAQPFSTIRFSTSFA